MELGAAILDFLETAEEDPRLGPLRFTLYLAICRAWVEQGRGEAVLLDRRVLMRRAKIASSHSYHKVIWELHTYGYVRYEPSFDREVGSRVLFNGTQRVGQRWF